MKTIGFVVVAMLAITGCNSPKQKEVEKYKVVAYQDSALLVQAVQKDSEISAYLNELNEIQVNLDKIKTQEKMVTINTGEDKKSIAQQINDLDEIIVLNDKKMNKLQAKIKAMTSKNESLESLVSHLMAELAERDEEITALQSELSKSNDSLKHITARFNDSIVVIKRERAKVVVLTTEMKTVYFVTGTLKDLQDKGVINKEGGFIGLGKVAVVNPQIDVSKFTKADMTELKGIALNGRFRRFITVHPDRAYVVISNGKTDSIAITIPNEFWSESKYLVVAIK